MDSNSAMRRLYNNEVTNTSSVTKLDSKGVPFKNEKFFSSLLRIGWKFAGDSYFDSAERTTNNM